MTESIVCIAERYQQRRRRRGGSTANADAVTQTTPLKPTWFREEHPTLQAHVITHIALSSYRLHARTHATPHSSQCTSLHNAVPFTVPDREESVLHRRLSDFAEPRNNSGWSRATVVVSKRFMCASERACYDFDSSCQTDQCAAERRKLHGTWSQAQEGRPRTNPPAGALVVKLHCVLVCRVGVHSWSDCDC